MLASIPQAAVSRRQMAASVIIVAFNSADCLAECLESVGRVFGSPEDEVIVVDNNSTDDSCAVVEQVYPTALLIRSERNEGFARAVNRGLEAAQGEYAVLVNPDTGCIQGNRERIEQLLAEPAVAAVALTLLDERGMVQRSCRTTPTPATIIAEDLMLDGRIGGFDLVSRHRMLDWDMASERDVDEASGALLCLSGDAVRRVGTFDERFFLYYEETDWLRRAKIEGLRTVYTPAMRAVHSARTSSGDADSATMEQMLTESMYAYVRKWHGPLAEVGVRVVFIVLDSVRLIASFARGPSARRRAAMAKHRLSIHLGSGVTHEA